MEKETDETKETVKVKRKRDVIYYMDGNNVVCLFVEDKKAKELKVISRGVAIKSEFDKLDTVIGAQYSYDRAMEAAGRKANCEPILMVSSPSKNGRIRKDARVSKLPMSLSIDRFGPFKGFYEPVLTNTEKLILDRKIKLFPIFKERKTPSINTFLDENGKMVAGIITGLSPRR